MHGWVDGWELRSRERETETLGSRGERERERERERVKGLNWAVSRSQRISTYGADTGVDFVVNRVEAFSDVGLSS